ncbi:transposase family protein [Nocardiopsis sp. CNS-639]|uniref:transposase family protein n=1 Tax=Nocardiopsis sp. CNS-639 TaxID=1169153 RepID=UPI00036622F1|nr:transposase family protein [Nocardiopsis sp. CNS-639]
MDLLVLDGTLIDCDPVADSNYNDAWYSGKAKHFADNLQFLEAPDGTSLWVSEVEPGS